MSQLTHVQDVKDTEKTKLSLVLHTGSQTICMLRICKKRDLSAVCKALRKIRNPNTAVVYDYVYHAGDTYILEESLSGQTVQEYMDVKGNLTEKETVRIIIAICNALEQLHREEPPVVHNDINPSNIMLREDGSVKLFDFDIARLYKKGVGQNTTLFGTEEYASPEHYGYGQSEPRTDIYCLGTTMHKMLTGETLSLEHRITYRGKMKSVLEKCLQFDPEKRYASVQALRKDLERFLPGKKRLLGWWLLCAFACVVAVAILMLTRPDELPETIPNSTDAAAQTHTTASAMPNETTLPENVETTAPQPSQDTEPETDNPTEKEEATTSAQMEQPTKPPAGQPESTAPTAVPAPPQETALPEKNDTRENASSIGVGQICLETIEKDKVPDWYKFVAGDQLSVYRVQVDCTGENPVNGRTVLQLYEGSRELKKVILDYRKSGFIDILLEPGKEYAIKVSGENTVPAVGDYTLQVTQRICDAGTDESSATPLTLGVAYAAKADSTLDDYYVFTVEQSGKYKITVDNQRVGCRLFYSGKRGGGSLFSGWADSETATERSFNAKAGDVIYIIIGTDDLAADGDYTVQIQ